MTPIKLRFIKLSKYNKVDDTRALYRIEYCCDKFACTVESPWSKTVIGKVLSLFGYEFKKLQLDCWLTIYDFAYPINTKWIFKYHPKKYRTGLVVWYGDIEKYKDKFKSLEDIIKYENTKINHYEKMIQLYNEQNVNS